MRSNEEMTAAGLLMKSSGQPNFHILHLPQAYKDGTSTFKVNTKAKDWDTLEKEVSRLLSCSGRTDKAIGGGNQAIDRRAQLHGAALRRFPRPPNPERDPSLHLAASFTAFLATADANALEFGSPTELGRALFCSHAGFRRTKFCGGSANFKSATFLGERASFESAEFFGSNTSFENAFFFVEKSTFKRSIFYSKKTSFRRAEFHGKNTDYRKAKFSGGNVYFTNVKFLGGATYFSDA